ncbi:hypothetical protein PspLS_05647 [Pyricularia sp. CBS 133598]|nr:hypothetical protein PspLS_05647 [Pyricularia sp. CBS 133598]
MASLRTLLGLLPLAIPSLASSLNSEYTFNPLHHLAGISPYFEPLDPPRSPDAPQGCTVTRAAYLSRHAAIYANDFDYEEYMGPFISKWKNQSSVDWARIPSLSFLAHWEPPVTEAEASLLTRMGKLEASKLGVDLSFRYPNLSLPQHVWTSSAERTFESAKSLVRGFQREDNTIRVVSVYEGKESGANSLTPYKACPAYSGSTGSEQSQVYQEKFAKSIKARFNAAAPGFNFTTKDVFGMMQLCGYESVIRGRSKFCDLNLFGPDDWLGWEYSEDIRYHYNVGYGFPAAGYIGMPWLQATADLMTRDGGPDAEDLYISFTHRELPPMVMVAMGLFNNSQFGGSEATVNATMPSDAENPHRAWRSSHVVPFLTNIALERLECSGSYGFDNGQYHRVLVNSSPQLIPGCNDGPGTSCSKAAFEQFVKERTERFKGFSEKCGVTYKNSTDTMSLYTDGKAGNGSFVGKRYNAFPQE